MGNERRFPSWDVLRSVLSIAAMLLAGLATFSARLVVERSDREDAELERRLELLERQISSGILPRSDERIMQLQREIERIERALERHIENDE